MVKHIVKNSIIIELNSCSNDCIFCDLDNVPRQISVAELKTIEIRLLKKVLDLKKKNLEDYVEISGSDPLEYRRIASFIKYLKNDLSFKTVVLTAHGRSLKNLSLVKELKKAGLDEISIPLYGSTDIIHDAITQKSGSFRETLRGIQNMSRVAPRIKMKITSLIMKQNYRDINNIFSLACSYASDIIFSIPWFVKMEQGKKFAVPLQKIRPYLMTLLAQSDQAEKNLEVLDIPFCIFGLDKNNIINSERPRSPSTEYSVSKSTRPDWNIDTSLRIFSYRTKKKLPVCDYCRVSYKCHGFYSGYLELFDFDDLKPL